MTDELEQQPAGLVHAQYFTVPRMPTGEAACGATPDQGGSLAGFGMIRSVTCRDCILVLRERGLAKTREV